MIEKRFFFSFLFLAQRGGAFQPPRPPTNHDHLLAHPYPHPHPCLHAPFLGDMYDAVAGVPTGILTLVVSVLWTPAGAGAVWKFKPMVGPHLPPPGDAMSKLTCCEGRRPAERQAHAPLAA